MTRAILPILLLAALGCAGLASVATPTARVERRAVSIDLLAGDVTEDGDHGSSGDYDVDLAGSTQSLSWEPLDDESLDDEIAGIYRALGKILPDQDWGDPPAHADVQVGGGLVGRGFVTAVPPAELHVSAWICADAGVRVQLVTAGFPAFARQLHERSLTSVACGAVPVEATALPHAWRLVDPTGWSSDVGETAPEGEGIGWWRDDRTIEFEVESTTPWSAPGVPALCTGTLRHWHDENAKEISFDEDRSQFLTTSDGCAHTWAGTDPDDGARISGRFELRTCGDRGYTFACFVHAPELGPEACAGLLACAE